MVRILVIGICALLLLLGLGFRAINLDQKAYWVDEVHTSVRVAGYTKADITAEQFDNQVHSVTDLKAYQIPAAEPSLSDVLHTLAQHPEHPPLYYLLARWWLQGAMVVGIPPSVTVTRSLSLILSLLVLPCVFGLSRELFRSNQTAIIALAIFALSPLHILYGQEAREYSLWTLMTVLSCWTVLRAIRHPSVNRWALYGLTLTVGWYSHLLFATVAIAHTFYFVLFIPSPSTPASDISPPQPQSSSKDSEARVVNNLSTKAISSPSPTATDKRSFFLTLATSILFFSPWIGVFLTQLGQVQNVVEATQRDPSLGYLFNAWGRNFSRVWFSADLGSVNILLVLGAIYALVYLWHTVPRRISGLILLVIGMNALVLLLPDMLTGGISSTRIRYLLPAYGGIQLAIAHLFSHHLQRSNGRSRRGWQLGLIALLICGTIAGCINMTQTTNWAKSDKSIYYPQMANAINASSHPLVITDTSATYTLVLAHHLKDQVNLQLVNLAPLKRPQDLVIPSTVDGNPIRDIFLFAPSPLLRRTLERRSPIPFDSVVRQNNQFQLLQTHSPLEKKQRN